MKIPARYPDRKPARAASSGLGFTLPEMLIAVAVFMLVLAGVLSATLFGLRLLQVAENKLVATDSVRKVVGLMTDEIRTASSTVVGNVSNGVFTSLSFGTVQAGNGLLICPTTTTTTTNFILYFCNPADQTFRRTSRKDGTTAILARNVTNTIVFSAQDSTGNTLTNNQNNRVIRFKLEFFQTRRAGVDADCYRLETEVTRRSS